MPPFQDHEGTVLAIVGADDPSLVPTVLAADRATGTVLLEDVSGEDQWEASAPVLREMVRRWVRTQARWVDRTDRLAEARIPDWRADAFRGSVAAMLERPEVRSSVEASVVAALDGLVADLPRGCRTWTHAAFPRRSCTVASTPGTGAPTAPRSSC